MKNLTYKDYLGIGSGLGITVGISGLLITLAIRCPKEYIPNLLDKAMNINWGQHLEKAGLVLGKIFNNDKNKISSKSSEEVVESVA